MLGGVGRRWGGVREALEGVGEALGSAGRNYGALEPIALFSSPKLTIRHELAPGDPKASRLLTTSKQETCITCAKLHSGHKKGENRKRADLCLNPKFCLKINEVSNFVVVMFKLVMSNNVYDCEVDTVVMSVM